MFGGVLLEEVEGVIKKCYILMIHIMFDLRDKLERPYDNYVGVME